VTFNPNFKKITERKKSVRTSKDNHRKSLWKTNTFNFNST